MLSSPGTTPPSPCPLCRRKSSTLPGLPNQPSRSATRCRTSQPGHCTITTPFSYARRLKLRMLRASAEHRHGSDVFVSIQLGSAKLVDIHFKTNMLARRARTALIACEEDRQSVARNLPAANRLREAFSPPAQSSAAWVVPAPVHVPCCIGICGRRISAGRQPCRVADGYRRLRLCLLGTAQPVLRDPMRCIFGHQHC